MSQSPSKKRRKVADDLQVFQHSPLDTSKPHIRLVRFLPNSRDGMLRLEIRNNVTLRSDACPEYRALSYEWGPPRPRRGILVDGKVFLIRKNLYGFLQILFDHHGGVGLGYFWADAVCIDQENVDEKSHQVQQMKAVYQQALQVMAWLGPSDNVHDGEVFDGMNLLEDDGHDSVVPQWQAWMFKDKVKPLALYALYCRPYWRRMWMVQELALASDILVLCGCYSAGYRQLEYAERYSSSFRAYAPRFPVPKTLQQQSVAFKRLKAYFKWEWGEPSLLWAMVYFGHSLCDLVHDRVYSLLGITNDANSLRIDYQISLEVLLLNVLGLASRDTTTSGFFALSTALSAAFVTQQSVVTLSCSSAGPKSEPIDIEILVQAIMQERDKAHLNLLRDTTGVLSPRLSRALSTSFEWTLFDMTSLEVICYSRTVVQYWELALATEDRACRCSLCSSQKQLSSEGVSQSIAILRVQASCRDDGIIDTRSFPEVFIVFEKAQYLATLLTRSDDLTWSPEAATIFRDPLGSSWKFEQSHPRLPNPSYSLITIPATSIFILLAHTYLKDGKLTSLT